MAYNLSIKFARTKNELKSAGNLRYRVFKKQFHSGGETFDHDKRIEWSIYDESCEHIICTASLSDNQHVVVGTLRIKRQLNKEDKFQVESEFDIRKLSKSKNACCEVSRICVDQSFRNGFILLKMWQFLFKYLGDNNIKILFGLGSFYGCDIATHKDSILTIFDNYVSPNTELISSVQNNNIGLMKSSSYNKVSGIRNIPDIIKTYLRFGCQVAPDYFVDYDFNTIDLFCILRLGDMSEKQISYLSKDFSF